MGVDPRALPAPLPAGPFTPGEGSRTLVCGFWGMSTAEVLRTTDWNPLEVEAHGGGAGAGAGLVDDGRRRGRTPGMNSLPRRHPGLRDRRARASAGMLGGAGAATPGRRRGRRVSSSPPGSPAATGGWLHPQGLTPEALPRLRLAQRRDPLGPGKPFSGTAAGLHRRLRGGRAGGAHAAVPRWTASRPGPHLEAALQARGCTWSPPTRGPSPTPWPRYRALAAARAGRQLRYEATVMDGRAAVQPARGAASPATRVVRIRGVAFNSTSSHVSERLAHGDSPGSRPSAARSGLGPSREADPSPRPGTGGTRR